MKLPTEFLPSWFDGGVCKGGRAGEAPTNTLLWDSLSCMLLALPRGGRGGTPPLSVAAVNAPLSIGSRLGGGVYLWLRREMGGAERPVPDSAENILFVYAIMEPCRLPVRRASPFCCVSLAVGLATSNVVVSSPLTSSVAACSTPRSQHVVWSYTVGPLIIVAVRHNFRVEGIFVGYLGTTAIVTMLQ